MIETKEIDLNKIKYTHASARDLVLALDRLTRFKFPEIKYYRVISDMLCKYLISPKLSKARIKELEVGVLKSLFEKVWNESVEKLNPEIKADKKLQNLLFKESVAAYNMTDEIKILADLDININAVLDLIEDTLNAPINLKRLLIIEKDFDNLVQKRQKFGLRFPVEKVVLCEGITEEILLPKFAKLAGYDFDRFGVKLISAGGKNQVAKLYCELKDELKIPVFILLDSDAVETSKQIDNFKRKQDAVYLIKRGEFEDIFSINLIKRTINKRFKNICECCAADFKRTAPMTKILAEFYRLHKLGDFQKADFAKELAQNLKYDTDLTEEILQIIEQIKNL